jgi:hypothetical protein
MAMRMENNRTGYFDRRDDDFYSTRGSIKAGSYAHLPKAIKPKFNSTLKSSQSMRRSKSPSVVSQEDKQLKRNLSVNKVKKTNPQSQVYKSLSKCHKYHTDLDYNYLMEKKFKNEALYCGRDRLSPVALREGSPDKCYFDKSQTPRNDKYGYIDSLNKGQIDSKRFLDDYYSNDKLKTSKGVISNVIDSQFSVNSPSKLKLYREEINQVQNDDFRKSADSRIYMNDNNTKLTINLSYSGENPGEKFLDALEAVMAILDPIFERCQLDEKIERFIEIVDDHRRNIRLGSLVALYLICKKYDLDDNYKNLIVEKTILLVQNYEVQEELFLVACLELLGLFSPNELLLENLNLICMFITDFNYPRLQKAAFQCIMNLEYDGIKV